MMMNTLTNGLPATPRSGYQVEVNALWYNAVCQTLDWAQKFGANADKAFVAAWKTLPEQIRTSFVERFVLPEGALADFVDANGANKQVRPNMIIACALPYKMLDEPAQLGVVRTVRQHLLTPRGLRTLSPQDAAYHGSPTAWPAASSFAGHNGMVWPWLLSFYVRACFDAMGSSFLSQAEQILAAFEQNIQSYGIGSIAELYDADPPYNPRGAVSQAANVGGILEIHQMITQAKNPKSKNRKSKI